MVPVGSLLVSLPTCTIAIVSRYSPMVDATDALTTFVMER
jgi:hypothetical protein